jgi:hypothetical protein
VDGETEWRTDRTKDGETWRKLIVAFRNFANAPKKGEGSFCCNEFWLFISDWGLPCRLLTSSPVSEIRNVIYSEISSCLKIKGHSWQGTVQNNNCYVGVLCWVEDEQYTLRVGNITNPSERNRTHLIFQLERHLHFLPIWELTGFNSRAQRPDILTIFFRDLLQSKQINAEIMTHCKPRLFPVKHSFNSIYPTFQNS